ncbi:hypothetical protein O3G_MSEX004560 [Manduca sexta]|uniref:Reverse transcriptase domain-containing protein n=1 Tax=Manduca sexta TaxID=7130 RepID=A0A921YXI4_MANSE|nr:hypothetical protein O3G_MSEX004560 [Manduca sexta]
MLNFRNGFGFGNPQKKQKMEHEYIEIFYQNARGLRTKSNKFYNNIHSSGADLIAITETGCNESILNAELIPPGYQILRCDRVDGRKQGGAFLVATHNYEIREVAVPGDININERAFELVCATVHKNSKFCFCCCVVYIPPSSNDQEYLFLFQIIEHVCVKYKNIIVVGDFNLNSSSYNTSNYYEYFVSFCEFTQKNYVPNCNGRQLDLVLCSLSVGECVSVREADEAIVPIDAYHPPLAIRIPIGSTARAHLLPTASTSTTPGADNYNTKSSLNKQWNFYKADYYLLYSLLASTDWTHMYSLIDPEEILTFFYNTLDSIMNKCVPRKKGKTAESRFNYPNWYTMDIIRNIKVKAKWHKLYKISKAKRDYTKFAYYRTRVKEMIAVEYKRHLDIIQRNITNDPKAFWQYVKSKKGTVNRKKITRDGYILTDSECANEFARFFHSVYSDRRAKLDVAAAMAASGGSSARVHIGRLDLKLVEQALSRLKPRTSAGPDGIPAFIIKDCSAVLAEPLLHLFNQCMDASYFPTRWKITRVIPVPKGEASSDISGYRPVAVLATPAKVFESIIHQCVFKQVSALLSDAQHGFRPHRSTNSNLLNFMTYVIPHVDAGGQVDCAYFDFKKAFDLVDNDILLTKLASVGCTPKLLNFFVSYMKDRQQYVEFAGYKSELYFTRSGVSQGSNLGPLNFILMINDLPNVVRDATCLLFADDLKLLLAIKDKSDSERLQQDIQRVVEWSKKNKLYFNGAKSSVITFSRRKRPYHHPYELDGVILNRKETVRDLGVCLDIELTFRNHIINVCKKTFRSLGFVLRRAEGFTDNKAITSLYNALVRSQLECNAVIWSPHETKYSLMLERIQNKFTRYLYQKLYGVYPFYPLMYPNLFILGMVGYEELATRRELALVTYLFKLIRGKIDNPGLLEVVKFSVPDNYLGRRRRPRLLVVPRGRTNLLNKAPITRALSTLNDVAEKIDIFLCTLSDFTKISLYLICYST